MPHMMKPAFEQKLINLFAFFRLPAPDEKTVNDCYKVLSKKTAGAIGHAFDCFREQRASLKMGENIAFILRQYADTWVDLAKYPSRTLPAETQKMPTREERKRGAVNAAMVCASVNGNVRAADYFKAATQEEKDAIAREVLGENHFSMSGTRQNKPTHFAHAFSQNTYEQ